MNEDLGRPKRKLNVSKSKSTKLAPPVELTYAFVVLTVGAGFSFVASAIGITDPAWATASPSAVVIASIVLVARVGLLVVLPVIAAFKAFSGHRWPVMCLSLISVFQLLLIGLGSIFVLLFTILTVLGTAILWLPNPRRYSKQMSLQRRELRG